MNNIGGEGIELWNREDGFFYDVLDLPDGRKFPMKVRSMVGLIPLFAVETLGSEVVDRLPGLQAAHAVVPREPARTSRSTSRPRRRRTGRSGGSSRSSTGTA